MRKKQHQRIEPRREDRKIQAAPTAPIARAAYPSLGEALDTPELASIVRAAVRVAACVGLLGAASAASGCYSPECSTGRWGEMKSHGGTAVDEVGRLELGIAIDELGVGLGISPHPMGAAIAGEAPMVSPVPPSPSSSSSGSSGGTP